MTDSIINDKRILRGCMLYEVLQNRPVFESYLNFCASLRCPEFDYREFEFWYFRFHRGLTDFDYDMSEELDNKPTLTDMPMDVVGRVLGNLNYKTHLVLRKVCKSLREIVDQRAPPYKSITLWIEDYGATVSFDMHEVRYRIAHMGGGSSVRLGFQQRLSIFSREDPVARAIRDVRSAVEHPKLRLDEFKIQVVFSAWGEDEKKREGELRKKYFDEIKDVLSTVPRGTLDVEKLEVYVKNQDEVLSILPFMTPGVLETIVIQSPTMSKLRLQMTQIVELEQWKRAKKLVADRFVVQFPIENIPHFETTWIRFAAVSMKQLRVLRDALLLSSNFVSLTLESSKPIDIDSIDEYLGADIPQDPPTPNYRYYPLPDCDDHVFEIHLHPKCLKMQRTSKTELLR